MIGNIPYYSSDCCCVFSRGFSPQFIHKYFIFKKKKEKERHISLDDLRKPSKQLRKDYHNKTAFQFKFKTERTWCLQYGVRNVPAEFPAFIIDPPSSPHQSLPLKQQLLLWSLRGQIAQACKHTIWKCSSSQKHLLFPLKHTWYVQEIKMLCWEVEGDSSAPLRFIIF